jgi:hypothetical protein
VLAGTYVAAAADLESLLLRRLGQSAATNDGGVWLGGGIRGGTSLRLYDKLQNSSRNLDIVASASAAAMWALDFAVFGKPFTVQSRLVLPVFSFVGRTPEYALRGFAAHWLPAWRFLRLSFESSISWQLRWSDENRSRLVYRWDFQMMDDDPHALRLGSHTVGLEVGLKRM